MYLLSYDWFIELFAFVLIAQSGYFVLGFTIFKCEPENNRMNQIPYNEMGAPFASNVITIQRAKNLYSSVLEHLTN